MHMIFKLAMIGSLAFLPQPLVAEDCSSTLGISKTIQTESDLPQELKDLLLELFPDLLNTEGDTLFARNQTDDGEKQIAKLRFLSLSVMNRTWFLTMHLKGYRYPHTVGFSRLPSGRFYLLPGFQFVGPKCSVLEAVKKGVGTDSLLLRPRRDVNR